MATIALVGNPNCGKTTLFNRLTGSNQYVGNWPGVTVEKKGGKLKGHDDITIIDLPGIYSLSPYTLEEVIARNYVVEEKPDAIVNIVDGTNLERNLYLTTQVLELGIPVVLAVNMCDIVKKNGDKIDCAELSKQLGCEVVSISAMKGTGVDDLVAKAVDAANDGKAPVVSHRFAEDVEAAFSTIETALPASVDPTFKRYFAVKMFERDEKAPEQLGEGVDAKELMSGFENIIADIEKTYDDDSESVIANGRYEFITSIIGSCYTRNPKNVMTTSDKIDRVVTNRWLALPIFAVVMFLVYFISVTTVGTFATDWANDGVFGDGWFLVGGGEEYDDAVGAYEDAQSAIEAYEGAAEEAGLDPTSENFVTQAKSTKLVAYYDAYDDETGENERVAVDADTYEEALEVPEVNPSDYGIWVPGIPKIVENWLVSIDAADWVQALVLDGIVAGVGAVLGFVPQMLVLFFMLAFLEYCGYMSRVAFILDRVFSKFGLSGKSFIPILIGTGCGVPGVLASRTIENQNDRRMTVMTTTFIPCGAKMPIVALFAGAVFGGAWWVAPSAYFLGIAVIICSGIILKKTRFFAGDATPFVMELPAYHLPTIGALLRSMWERAWSFIKKAGTIILLATIVVWFISSYGFGPDGFGVVEDQNDSILAIIGGALAWIFSPLGWGEWQSTAATITGLIAKENVVSTYGVLYAGDAGWYASLQAALTPLACYSLLAFNLLCAPCFAAMGTIRREMNNRKWFWAAIGWECGVAYVVALWIFQIGGLICGEVGFGFWTIVAIALVVFFLYMLFRPNPAKRKRATATVAAEA